MASASTETTFNSVDESVVTLDKTPVKPGIPLMLLLALMLWVACGIAYGQFEHASIEVMICWLVGSVILACIACLCLIFLVRLRYVTVLILGMALGITCASYGAIATSQAEQFSEQSYEQLTFELLEDASKSSYGSKAIARAYMPTGETLRVQMYFDENVDLLCGERINASCKLTSISETSRSYCWNRGISAVAQLHSFQSAEGQSQGSDQSQDQGQGQDSSLGQNQGQSQVRDQGQNQGQNQGQSQGQDQGQGLNILRDIRRQAIDMFDEYGAESAGVLQALVCGYRNTITESGAYNSYKTLGLAHIVAVSGAHLAIVTTSFEWLLSLLRAPRKLRLVMCALFSCAYVVFAGVPISAVRAAFMVVLTLAASGAKRRASSLNALALCVIACIAVDPVCAMSSSFFLSVGSTLGIILFAGLITSWFSALPRRLLNIVGKPAGLTLASNIVAQPYSAALFSQLPLLALPANIIAAPLFSLACVVGLFSAVLSCVFTGAAPIFIAIASLSAMPLSFVVTNLAQIPYACIALEVDLVPMILLSVVICIVLWLVWPRLSLRFVGGASGCAIMLVLVILLVSPRLYGDEIVMLDVGQGDAFLIRSKGSALLIDVGTQDSLLRSALGREGIYSLDGVVISHSDDDHYGSLPVLSGLVNVDGVYVAQDALSCGCDSCAKMLTCAQEVVNTDAIYGLSVGDVITLGDFTLEVVWPETYVDEGENTDSVCLNVALDCDQDGYVDWTSFFCGDAESNELDQLVTNGALGKIDVLKVGHHGSRVALNEDLAELLHPRIALISVGAHNRYGHPKQETLDYLNDVDALILRTDEMGDVKLTFDECTIKVS